MQNINQKFEVANIENINSKRGKGKAEKFFGYDIKVKTECTEDFLKLLAHGIPPDYNAFFFDDDGSLKPSYVSSFTISRDIVEHRLLIDLDTATNDDTMRLMNISITDFKIIPVMGFEYLVRFTVRTQTNDDELLFLNRARQLDNVILTIEEPIQIGAEL